MIYNGFNISDKNILIEKSKDQVSTLILGIGGMGTNAVTSLFSTGMNEADFAIINVYNGQNNNMPYGIKKVILKDPSGKPLSTNGSIENGESIALLTEQAWKQVVSGYDVIIIIAGLGGGTGGGMGPIIAQYSKKKSKSLVISIVTMPFTLEGESKKLNAIRALKKFKASSNTTIVLENDVIFNMFRNLPFQRAIEIMNSGIIYSIIETLLDIIKGKSTHMSIDFDVLKEIMKNGGESTVIYGEGEKNNVDNIVRSMFNSRFSSLDPSNYKNAIININSDENFTYEDLDKISKSIFDVLGDRIDVRFSIKTQPNFREKIKITGILIKGPDEEINLKKENVSDYAITDYYPIFF
ncbi:MAG: hypothetical protein ACP5JE_04965 [Thermoplasmata archaeon]|jgi:cell division protein FtsZ